MTNAEFAEAIDVQPSNISHIMSGRNKPSLDLVMKVLKKFPELHTEWLLHGKGAMNRDFDPFAKVDGKSQKKKETLLFSDEILNQNEAMPVVEKNIAQQPPMQSESRMRIPEVKDEEPARYATGRSYKSMAESDFGGFFQDKKVEKIVLFYNNHTFKEYYPEK